MQRLRQELDRVRQELQKKTEACLQLTLAQANVDTDIHDLTEQLFSEAYKMAADASRKQERAERLLKEAEMKNDGLQAEVQMLKALIKDGTPNTNRSFRRTARELFTKKEPPKPPTSSSSAAVDEPNANVAAKSYVEVWLGFIVFILSY